jgi:threonylcarbamoyladenosine tRNA methylthiotransferase MtaB
VRYSVITFGCRVNQADSLAVEEELRVRGAVSTSSPEQADLVIINTCSVTASADQAARQMVRRLARANPDARIVVTGCYATRQPDAIRILPNVARVVPNAEKPRLLALVAEDGWSTAARFGDGEGACGAVIEPGVAGRTAFTLRVQTGCSQPCSYCIIPATRGAPRSVPLPAVLTEVDRIVGLGFKEIAITGVHLGSYGRDFRPASSLVDLLRALRESTRGCGTGRSSEGPGVLFRISSLEPADCSREIVDLVAEGGCLAPHFHLPLQHASDRVLAAMRRPYTIAQYADLVASIRARIPDAAIGSDVIVGFPGESDRDFAELCTYLERAPLTHLHVFPYSDRPDTAAASMDRKVPGVVVRARASQVRQIGHGLTMRFRTSQRGTVHRGLTIEDGSLVVTDNYLKVTIPPGRRRNEWVRILITETAGPVARGEILLCSPEGNTQICC